MPLLLLTRFVICRRDRKLRGETEAIGQSAADYDCDAVPHGAITNSLGNRRGAFVPA